MIIAGCGFLGEATAVLFLREGWDVLGLTASEESAARLREIGLHAAAIDITQPLQAPEGWREPDVLIHSASSGRGGADAYRAVYLSGMRNLIDGFRPGRAIFTGSTSVFAQADDSIVTEESPAEPPRETGQLLLKAEDVALNAGGTVARLAGIYGPGRSVLLRKYREGSAVLEAGGRRWINQIHRDDGASALRHLADPSVAAGIYNVSDDTPATQREIYSWIANALGGELPAEGPADLNRKRGWTSKRVSNAKLRATGWRPRYPSYRDALAELIASTHAA